jgi:hypothetical protein
MGDEAQRTTRNLDDEPGLGFEHHSSVPKTGIGILALSSASFGMIPRARDMLVGPDLG